MSAGINLDRFCKDLNIKVKDGIMTGMIRPAGKTDVTVKIDGLDFNTPDPFVMDYLSKFGTVKTNTVIYGKYDTGPFKGKYNGDRRYQVDFSRAQKQMGTYHLIDGSKVRVFYRGNRKTCGRCHKLASECPGEAIARNCALGGGARVFLTDHMKKVWNEIGFVPTSFELEENDKTEDDAEQATKDAPIIAKTSFPPKLSGNEPNNRDIELFNGIIVKNLPKHLEEKEIVTFLVNHGMPIDHDIEKTKIMKGEKNTRVLIDGLSPADVETMHKSIHFLESNSKFFGVPLYCKPIRNLTPRKPNEEAVQNDQIQTDDTKTDDNKETMDVETVDVETVDVENVDVEPTKTPKLVTQPKPKIPGLEEKDRLRAEKKMRKKKNKEKKKEEKLVCNLSQEDFLVSPQTGLLKDKTHNFVFSDYTSDHDESDDSESYDEFEDSKEALSDIEKVPESSDPFTPVRLKSSFARTLLAKSVSRPSSTSTPGGKRSASSPADSKEKKKSRGRSKSQIPKKK